MECKCNSLRDCPALQNVFKALILYQNSQFNNNNNRAQLIDYFQSQSKDIIDDYCHVLDHTMNKESNACALYIEKEIKKHIKCNLEECKSYDRNARNIEKNTKMSANDDDVFNYYVDLMDVIHCYMVHSVDIGFRIDPDKCESKHGNENDYKLYKTRGKERTKKKFQTSISDMKCYKFGDGDSFGLSYRESEKHWPLYTQAHFSDFKSELLPKMTLNALNYAMTKCKMFLKLKKVKQLKLNRTWWKYEEIETVALHHILSIVLYTDFDDLQFKFKETYRRTHEDETDQSLIARHSKYYFWAKYLDECLERFSDNHYRNENSFKVLYHGTSLLLINQFYVRFHQPTSTTPELAVATTFCEKDNVGNLNGLILELENNLQFFDCAYLSRYPLENEKLLFGRDFKITNVRVFQNGFNVYTKPFISALMKFDIYTKRWCHQEKQSITVSDEEMKIIGNMLSENISDFPIYIQMCIQQFRNAKSKNKIWIDDQKYCGLELIVLSSQCKQLFRFDLIFRFFRKCIEIQYEMSDANYGPLFWSCLYDQLDATKFEIEKRNDTWNNITTKKLIIKKVHHHKKKKINNNITTKSFAQKFLSFLF